MCLFIFIYLFYLFLFLFFFGGGGGFGFFCVRVLRSFQVSDIEVLRCRKLPKAAGLDFFRVLGRVYLGCVRV